MKFFENILTETDKDLEKMNNIFVASRGPLAASRSVSGDWTTVDQNSVVAVAARSGAAPLRDSFAHHNYECAEDSRYRPRSYCA